MGKGSVKRLVIAIIVALVLGGMFSFWLASTPAPAAGEDRVVGSARDRQVNDIIRQIDQQR